MHNIIPEILKQFGLRNDSIMLKRFGNGLINHTWLIETEQKKYIMQRVNHNIFTNPFAIDQNIKDVSAYLKQHHPGYLFTVPVASEDKKTMALSKEGEYFRLFDFVEGSHSYSIAAQPQLAYEAAKQFGRFTKLLGGFNSEQLSITLSHFHNLDFRYCQFEEALQHASPERLTVSTDLIHEIKAHKTILKKYQSILNDPMFKKRVTHHDTKISNVLFDDFDKGICVIDLDTVMPGYFISDVGDMMRTYLSAAGEEETELEKVKIRIEYFEAIVEGYLGEMKNELSQAEINAFVYAGKFMIYMQALRFLTDYLNNDIYYGAKYPMHNFTRAANQLTLLNSLIKNEPLLNEIVNAFSEKHGSSVKTSYVV
jgi:Ser/Thr protein kinase RdoA (MazF antagonist)